MSLDLARDANAEVSIYDALGRRVSTPHEGVLAAGRHEITWDGRDVHGARAHAGVYFARARSEGAIRTQRIVLAD
jgi:flagellar hook assembly protein FlgD